MLVRALYTVKVTASDRSWPHMRGTGRSRLAPRIGHHRGDRAEVWQAGASQAGVAGFDFPFWYGIWVPAGTPVRVVDKLAKDIARALAEPNMREWLAKHGADPMNMTQPEFARFVHNESESAARLIKSAP